MENNILVNKYKNKPSQWFLVYSLFTFFLYFFGAYDYYKINQFFLIIYVLICNAFMYFGFVAGASKNYIKKKGTFNFPIKKYMTILFWISIIMIIPKFYIFTRISVFDISELLNRITTFAVSAQDLYIEHHSIERVSGVWAYINYLVVFLSPLCWIYYILSMFLWPQLSTFQKIGSMFIWTLTILQYVCSGTNVGIIEFIGLFSACRIVHSIGNYKRINKHPVKVIVINGKRINFRKKSFIYIGGSVLLALLMFATVMDSRIGASYENSLGMGSFLGSYSNSGINELLPDSLKPLYAYVTRYFAGGYRGLALSFDVDFNCTFGVGHSSFLLNKIDPTYSGLWQQTYNMQIFNKFGYPFDASWHTAYLWFANDVSLLGVPFLLLFLMHHFGKMWRNFLETGNLVAFIIFMIYVKMMFFISANNQVFRVFDTMAAFWILSFLFPYSCHWNWRSNEL